ncbi:MAG: hypothetical protein JXR05_13925 [Flavobacteriaceae bacterium]
MKTEELILTTIILIVPNLLALIASIYYVKKKNNLISKFLLAGSFLMFITFCFIFYVMPSLRNNNIIQNDDFMVVSLVMASIGYMTFFITFFFHIRKIVKIEKIRNDKDELENIGK